MKKFAVYIHTVEGGDAAVGEVEANSQAEVFEKIYRDNLFYDYSYKRKSFRINLSHITKVIVVEMNK